MVNEKDDITITKVETQLINDNNKKGKLFIQLDEAQGFRKGDTVVVLSYKDFSNMIDVRTRSELKRKLESYADSFKRVGELKMKLESMEIFYKEQLHEIKAQYNHQIKKLTKKIV